jgi:hypothetical protein
MGLFTREAKPAFGAAPEERTSVKAAAGAAGQLDNYLGYVQDYSRAEAVQNPTISRARDLIVSFVSGLEFCHYAKQWNPLEEDYVEVGLPLDAWMEQPDPQVTRQFLIGWTVDDLYFHSRAYWYVTSRSQSTGKPLSFQWLPAADVEVVDMSGPLYPAPSKKLRFLGFDLDPNNVIQFLSPIQGLLSMGWRSIQISNRLDNAAMRFATNEITAGYLQQTPGSEPMEPEDLQELAAAWSSARKRNAIGALNASVTWHEFQSDPSKLQLVEARTHQIRELANVGNVPGYLVGAPSGSGMTYQNAQESQKALYLYGAKPYIDTISQRLSMSDVVPRGRYVRLDVDDFVGVPEMPEDMSTTQTVTDTTTMGVPS